MVAAGGGSIINVSSTGAVRPTRDIVPYAAAKAGVNAMTVGLAHAFGPAVRVNAIMPGPFLTTIAQCWDMEVFAERARTFPARRAGEAEEIVGAALYLASDASSYTTGTVLTVDGGAQWSMAGTGERLPDLKSDQVPVSAPAMSAKPLWLRAVHRLERAVGEPVEAAVRTETYFDVMTKVTRTTKGAKRKVSGASTRGLHLLNLPAGTDVRNLRDQLARMERRLNQLSEHVEGLD